MLGDAIQKTISIGEKKVNFLSKNLLRYLSLSALAGAFVGVGILLIFTIGGLAGNIAGPFAVRTIMGISFGIALSLVIFAGSELFTGNNLVLTISSLAKKTTWMSALKIWIISYLGNFIGSIFVAWIYHMTKLDIHAPGAGEIQKFFLTIATGKMNAPFIDLFFKGFLCNILVCLAVWCSIKMTSESGKLIMIWWCLFAFITIGLEHSIANMTIFGVVMFNSPEFILGMFKNLIPVTLGNLLGGVGLGAIYYYIGNKN